MNAENLVICILLIVLAIICVGNFIVLIRIYNLIHKKSIEAIYQQSRGMSAQAEQNKEKRIDGRQRDITVRENERKESVNEVSTPQTMKAGVLFCRKCEEKYSANLLECPKCKTPR